MALARTGAHSPHAGYEGLLAGERVVVPGAVNKARVLARRVLPRRALLAAAERTGTQTG